MNNLTILYVEDDLEAMEDTKYLLNEFFAKVYTAQDGKEALEKYAEIKPDILVLDINLPKVNGIEVASAVRETNEEIPILFITAFSDKEMLLKAIDISASGYIVKPYKISELQESINKIITKKFNLSDEFSLAGGFIWHKKEKILMLENQNINLTKNERNLLELLCDNKTQFFKPSEIEASLSKVDQSIKENNVVQLISRFRNKITSKYEREPYFIENVYGLGYRISTNP